VQNRNDELCFLYSILAHIQRVESDRNPSRVCHYRPHLAELVTTGLKFPLPVSDVAKFERLKENIAVNVVTFDESQPILLFVTPHRQRKHIINLLLLTNDETDAHHYVLVRDLSHLVSGKTKHHGKAFVCQYCFHFFICEHTLTDHIPNCSTHTPQAVTYPVERKDAVLHYKTTLKEFPVAYVFYVDFETFIEPSADRGSVSEHVPSGFCCLKVSKFDDEIFSRMFIPAWT